MKKTVFITGLLYCSTALAQTIPNGDFKKWDPETHCPASWNCNNDADCKGKITPADKIKGGAQLTIMHCFDPEKDDRSNNVNISYDDLSAKIPKGKKVKISLEYSFAPVAGDVAYIKIDADFDEEINNGFPQFTYDGSDNGILKPGSNIKLACYLNFDPAHAKTYTAPQACTASSIRTTLGIMPATGGTDVHKGTTLIINHVKFELE